MMSAEETAVHICNAIEKRKRTLHLTMVFHAVQQHERRARIGDAVQVRVAGGRAQGHDALMGGGTRQPVKPLPRLEPHRNGNLPWPGR